MSKKNKLITKDLVVSRAAGELTAYPVSSNPKNPKSAASLQRFLTTVLPRFVNRCSQEVFGIEETSEKMRRASLEILNRCDYVLFSLINKPGDSEAYRPRNLLMVLDDWRRPISLDGALAINHCDLFDRVVLPFDKNSKR